MRACVLFAVALLLYGCHRAPLHCRTEYLYPDYLASTHVLTPDPCRKCFFGEQIVIKWDIERQCLPVELVLHVRYGNREQETVAWPIANPKGYQIYRLVNDDYWCSEGILSYKAELYKDGLQIADWEHHLWVEIIEIQEG